MATRRRISSLSTMGPDTALLAGCLIVLSCATSLLALVVDLAIADLYRRRVSLCDATEGWQRPAVWLGSAVLLAVLSAVMVRAAPHAAGSGVPQVKAALAGQHREEAFTLRTMGVKCLALTGVVAGGLAIGKEGPLIHVACCLAHSLANWLRPDVATAEFRLCLLTAAAALGVVCTFGAPVGGVLFSIELTSLSYKLDHLPGAFLAVTYGLALFAIGMRPLLSTALGGDPFVLFSTAFPHTTFDLAHLGLFALLGGVAALGAALLLRLIQASLLGRWRRHPTVGAAMAASACATAALLLSNGDCRGFFAEGGSQTLVRGRHTEPSARASARVAARPPAREAHPSLWALCRTISSPSRGDPCPHTRTLAARPCRRSRWRGCCSSGSRASARSCR